MKMMKKERMMLLMLAFVCQLGYGQNNVNQLFDEFSRHESTVNVKLGKVAMAFANLFQNTMGVNGIEVVSLEECGNDLKEQFHEAVRNLKDPSFDTLITVNEDGSRVKVLVRIEKEVIRELVVLVSGDDAAIVRLKGKIKKSDIEKLVNEHSR